VIDVSNPATPTLLGRHDTVGSAFGVQVVDNLAYVADGPGGLQLVRLWTGISQSLSFTLPPSLKRTDSPVTLAATASSGLPVNYRVVSGPASVTGDRLTLTGAGIVVVRAEQTGNAQFNPTSVETSASVVATEEPPVVLLSPGKDGMLMLEVLAPSGQELIVETTTDLRTWTEVTRVTGLGMGAPVKVPLTPAPGEPTRFWRVRR
jgi:hypothetical protein